MSRALHCIGCVAILACHAAVAHAAQPARDALTRGTHAERALDPAGAHSYQIELEQGDFIEASIVPRGIDVAVTLTAPDGTEILDSDIATDTDLAEHVLAVAAAPGRYGLKVRGVMAGAPAGAYVVSFDVARPSTSVDAARVDAMRKLESAVRLIRKADRASRQQGLGQAEQSREGFRTAGDSAGESWATVEMAWAQDLLLDQQAVETAREAVDLCRGAGDREWLPSALFVLGMMRLRNADATAAQRDLEEALSLIQVRRDVMAESKVRNGLGILFGRTGDAERAVEQFKIALAEVRWLRWRQQENSILNNLGIATKDLGEYKTSLDYYGQTLALSRELKDPGYEANALNNLGNLHRLLSDYPRALESHQAALALARQVGNRDHEGRALNALGWTYFKLGEYRRALDYYEQSLAIRRAVNDPAGLASTLDGAGMALHQLGDDAKALDRMNEGLRLRREVAERYAEIESLAHLAVVERDRGELDAALANIEAAVQLADSLRGRVMSPDLRASFVAAEDERYNLYVDVLMQLARARPTGRFEMRALEAGERGRARVLLESLLEARTDIREGIQPALLEQERAALRTLDEASARLSRSIAGRPDAKALQTARAVVERATAEYQRIEERIRTDSPKYAALTQPRPLQVEEIQRDILDDDSVLLEFDVGEQHGWLWAVTRTSLDSFELPPRARIETSARRLYASLTARQPRLGETAPARASRIAAADSQWRRDAEAFSRMILGRAAETLGSRWRGKRLIVAADGVLEYLPFSSLPDPLHPASALVQRHEIVYVPSVSVISAIRAEGGSPRASKSIAIVADPVFEADDPRVGTNLRPASTSGVTGARASRFSRLPFSRQEALAISALVPPRDVLRAMGFDASRSLVTNGGLGDYRIVHFATHGVLNSETPRLSGLMLSRVGRDGRAQDGFLRLNDIYNLRMPADVVVLSACQTALGKEIRGEGLVGLTRGFMYAGARRVVASLWEVDDLATAELMRWFYRGMLKDGLAPAAALRAAQRRLSREPQWSAPFYWSGFVIQGEWK